MNYENKKRSFYLNEIYYDFLLLEYFLPIERKTRHFKMFSFQAFCITIVVHQKLPTFSNF